MRVVNLKDLKNQKIAGIYKLDYPNGKVYIGQSQNIYKRINEHNSYSFAGHGSCPLQLCEKAIQKYGRITTFTILEEVQDVSELDDKEAYWIQYYDSTNRDKGYNIASGGNVSGKRGIEHPNAAFTEQTLSQVIDLLINHTELSYIDIANLYGVEQNTIYRISAGFSYVNPKLQYPLRKNCHDYAIKNDVLDYFNSQEQLLQLKEDIKYRWDLSLEKDLTEKYNLPKNIVREINHGDKFKEYGDYTYPIRNKNVRNSKNLTIDDVKNILKELRETNITMTDIGIKYNFGRNAIAKINKGETYLIKDYDYPARKTK